MAMTVRLLRAVPKCRRSSPLAIRMGQPGTPFSLIFYYGLARLLSRFHASLLRGLGSIRKQAVPPVMRILTKHQRLLELHN